MLGYGRLFADRGQWLGRHTLEWYPVSKRALPSKHPPISKGTVGKCSLFFSIAPFSSRRTVGNTLRTRLENVSLTVDKRCPAAVASIDPVELQGPPPSAILSHRRDLHPAAPGERHIPNPDQCRPYLGGVQGE